MNYCHNGKLVKLLMHFKRYLTTLKERLKLTALLSGVSSNIKLSDFWKNPQQRTRVMDYN